MNPNPYRTGALLRADWETDKHRGKMTHLGTPGEHSHLQATERGSGKNQPCPHLHVTLCFQTSKKNFCRLSYRACRTLLCSCSQLTCGPLVTASSNTGQMPLEHPGNKNENLRSTSTHPTPFLVQEHFVY